MVINSTNINKTKESLNNDGQVGIQLITSVAQPEQGETTSQLTW
jgi:hypothetical protein